MNWKRNPTLVIALCIALIVAVVVIAILIVYKGSSRDNAQSLQTPPLPHQQQNPPPSPSIEDDYQTTVGSGKPTLVLFYADWCGHSKSMMPSWEKISQTLNGSGKFEAIALEQKQHGSEMKKHNVQGFPDIRLYPDGFPSQNAIPYRGNRSSESLMKFVQSGGQEI